MTDDVKEQQEGSEEVSEMTYTKYVLSKYYPKFCKDLGLDEKCLEYHPRFFWWILQDDEIWKEYYAAKKKLET